MSQPTAPGSRITLGFTTAAGFPATIMSAGQQNEHRFAEVIAQFTGNRGDRDSRSMQGRVWVFDYVNPARIVGTYQDFYQRARGTRESRTC